MRRCTSFVRLCGKAILLALLLDGCVRTVTEEPLVDGGAGLPSDAATVEGDAAVAASRIVLAASLPEGVAEQPYSGALTASGGVAPYRFALSGGVLAPGLVLALDGRLSGVPTAPGAFEIELRADDSGSPMSSGILRAIVTVKPPAARALELDATPLRDAPEQQGYSNLLRASGGTPPYDFSLSSGALPPGLTLASSGELSGTPTRAGSSSFTVRVRDASTPPKSATRGYTLEVTTVAPPLTISTTALPLALKGNAYSATLAISGGTPPYQARLKAGSLPAGLALSSTGSLAGTPTVVGDASFTVEVSDLSHPAASTSQPLQLTVVAPLVSLTPALKDGAPGIAQQLDFTEAGGTAGYLHSEAPGSVLPPGFELEGARASGAPGSAGSFGFRVQVNDKPLRPADQQLVTFDFLFKVPPSTGTVLELLAPVIPATAPFKAVQARFSARGGSAPYRFALAPPTRLPPGLFLDSGGLLQGQPSVSGSFWFTLAASDASSPPQLALRTVNLVVAGQGGALAFDTALLLPADAGLPYSALLRPSGGSGGLTFSLARGALPPGLLLSPGGAISGLTGARPGPLGNYEVLAEVTDQSTPPLRAQQPLAIRVVGGASDAAIHPRALAVGFVGSPYRQPLSFTGLGGAASLALDSGSLPAGLSFSGAAVAGTPAVAGSAPVVIAATGGQTTALLSTTLLVLPDPGGLALSLSTLPEATLGVPYALPLDGTSGLAPYALALPAGATLPPGLTLVNGTLGGTPTAAGPFSFEVQLTDSAGTRARFLLELQIAP